MTTDTEQTTASTGNGRKTGRRLPIQTAVGMAAGLMLLICGGMAGVSLVNAYAFDGSLTKALSISSALRNQLTADMYHDAIKGVVYKALYGAGRADEATVNEARDELSRYAVDLKASLGAQSHLALPGDIRQTLEALGAPLASYVAQAEALVSTAASDGSQAALDLPKFEAAFTTLESSMAVASEAITKADASVADEAGTIVRLAEMGSIALAVFSLAVAAGLWVLFGTLLGRPLRRLTTEVSRLARGDLAIGERRRAIIREIDELSSSIDAFRDNAVMVANLTAEQHGHLARAADAQGQIAAISKSQAVIEFSMAGEVLTANENFCAALGYELDEIKGRHHRMFVDATEANTIQYREFWDRLGRGEYQAAEYRRIGKGGREVWIQATYNPICDLDGKPYKVVKFATDVTGRKAAVDSLGVGLARLAEGDLMTRIEQPFIQELEELRTAFNQTVAKFSGIVGQMRQTSRALKTATSEILSGANDLAERTTKQAAAIEETSAAMEQLSTTVMDNAKRADSANERSREATQTAEETGEVMRLSNDAMQRISTSSAKISGIIGMIDDIAFQTNLLALNASVEAARAGDAGKGFAVVAVEVRRLAQSAASASAEVKSLIEQSGVEVSGGSRLVAEAATKLEGMLRTIRQSASLIDGIAKATQEQSSAIMEVSTAVKQMDEMTQHNAALVEETNAAIEQTEAQANELDRIVDLFVIENRAPMTRGTSRSEGDTGAHNVKSLQARAQNAARSYLTHGNAAVQESWTEF